MGRFSHFNSAKGGCRGEFAHSVLGVEKIPRFNGFIAEREDLLDNLDATRPYLPRNTPRLNEEEKSNFLSGLPVKP